MCTYHLAMLTSHGVNATSFCNNALTDLPHHANVLTCCCWIYEGVRWMAPSTLHAPTHHQLISPNDVFVVTELRIVYLLIMASAKSIDTPMMDESDSSSQPPPGRPGDTEDFFVPVVPVSDAEEDLEQNTDIKSADSPEPITDPPPNHSESKPPLKSSKAPPPSNLSNPKPPTNHHHNSSSHNAKNSSSKTSRSVPPSSSSSQNHHHHGHRSHSSKTKPSVHSKSQQRDFQRATKWDIVYLTSSPLVFGCDPYKPLEQLDISGERNQFWNTLKQSKQRLSVIHKTGTKSIGNILSPLIQCTHSVHSFSPHHFVNTLSEHQICRKAASLVISQNRSVCSDCT